MPFAGLLLALLGGTGWVSAQPRLYRVGVVVEDRVDSLELPAHMQRQHPLLLKQLRRDVHALFAELGRFRTFDLPDEPDEIQIQDLDFVVRAILKKAHKGFRNQVFYGGPREDHILSPSGDMASSASYEVVSLPAITGRLEMQLVELPKGKIFWSALRDSTAVVRFDRRICILNPEKYPGATHPALLRDYLADIIRLQHANRSVDRILNVADRWFVSEPGPDLETARSLLTGLVASFSADLDGNLPLEGQIEALLPEEDQKQCVRLNIGAKHGLALHLRLDVWRPSPSGEKVGQIEVVTVDSTTAVARLRKLDRKMRRRGEGLQPFDRVVSRKRSLF